MPTQTKFVPTFRNRLALIRTKVQNVLGAIVIARLGCLLPLKSVLNDKNINEVVAHLPIQDVNIDQDRILSAAREFCIALLTCKKELAGPAISDKVAHQVVDGINLFNQHLAARKKPDGTPIKPPITVEYLLEKEVAKDIYQSIRDLFPVSAELQTAKDSTLM